MKAVAQGALGPAGEAILLALDIMEQNCTNQAARHHGTGRFRQGCHTVVGWQRPDWAPLNLGSRYSAGSGDLILKPRTYDYTL
jgi:hypothetical protein